MHINKSRMSLVFFQQLDWDASNSKSKPTLEDLQSKVAAMDAAEPMKD